jgi:UDP-N-acetylglucosamine 2-epimerase
MKIVSIVGARPQFIKAAALSRRLRNRHTELLVHTGQHYDDTMSRVFFEELEIPQPAVNLEVGSGSHGAQTGAMLAGIEGILLREKPDWVIVYGDTNSTLAGGLAAAKLQIPVAHVEAGLRSFNRAMPEEINRILTDHLSALLFCPSQIAADHLRREGIEQGVHIVGDVMADALLFAAQRAVQCSTILERFRLSAGAYWLVTVHRAENTDNLKKLQAILDALTALPGSVIFPVHPRTRKCLGQLAYSPPEHVQLIDPVGYLDMVCLEKGARAILTDSGGIQKEAYWLGVPCITLRDETEWVETIDSGWNTLTGANTERIMMAVQILNPPSSRPILYGGDGQAAERCLNTLDKVESHES